MLLSYCRPGTKEGVQQDGDDFTVEFRIPPLLVSNYTLVFSAREAGKEDTPSSLATRFDKVCLSLTTPGIESESFDVCAAALLPAVLHTEPLAQRIDRLSRHMSLAPGLNTDFMPSCPDTACEMCRLKSSDGRPSPALTSFVDAKKMLAARLLMERTAWTGLSWTSSATPRCWRIGSRRVASFIAAISMRMPASLMFEKTMPGSTRQFRS